MRFKIARIQEGLGQIVHDLAVGGVVTLMLLHDVGEDVPILRQGEGFHRLQTGEGLEAEFRDVTEEDISDTR